MTYRVISKRWDMPAEKHEFESSSDLDAKQVFTDKYLNNSIYNWDYLDLYKIDVVEKTTFMGGRSANGETFYHV
jgi:hypothetical protein